MACPADNQEKALETVDRPDAVSFPRKIRSFMRREGRMSKRQKRAIEQYFKVFGIAYSERQIDLNTIFNRDAPKVVEIGFGMGDALMEYALSNPEQDFLGIDVHRPGVGSLLAGMSEQSISNIRTICHDAVEVLNNMIADSSIDRINIFFPDPWPKKKHFKRRLIQNEFANLLALKIKPGGKLHIATDWEEYSTWISEILNTIPHFKDVSDQEFIDRPPTKFEKRGIELGHGVWDKIYIRQ